MLISLQWQKTRLKAHYNAKFTVSPRVHVKKLIPAIGAIAGGYEIESKAQYTLVLVDQTTELCCRCVLTKVFVDSYRFRMVVACPH